jgi:hypothetical protein
MIAPRERAVILIQRRMGTHVPINFRLAPLLLNALPLMELMLVHERNGELIVKSGDFCAVYYKPDGQSQLILRRRRSCAARSSVAGG